MFRKLAPLALAIAVAASLTNIGCDGDDGGPAVVVTVEVSPPTATVASGSTQQYTAVARDGNGNAISGVTFTWSSADQTVASVDNTGLATAAVMGTTYVRARTAGVTDSAEIVVIPNSLPDPPDDQFQDTNGDGIDGEIAGAVFVAPPPTGDDGNAGTPEEPKATIAAALAAALADANKDQVYISSGTYSETVELENGISLYGGYDAASDWERSFSNTATIAGDTIAVLGLSITQPTIVDLLTIESADNTQLGGNSIGIYLAESTLPVLRNLTVTAGDGGAGIAGTAGSQGLPGKPGSAGIIPDGGAGGDTVMAADPARPGSGKGGDGGNGSEIIGVNGGDGLVGLPTPGGGGGGAGGLDPLPGNQDQCAVPGLPGGDGGIGSFGLDGLAGDGGDGDGSVPSGYWVGSPGADGTYGAPGFGGGGGGGGSAGRDLGAAPCVELWGGGGGGGGSGGQGGDFGTGGLGGGGSFGIFIYNTTVDIELSTITAANGGAGGAGSEGGPGGPGGAGGLGSGGDVSQGDPALTGGRGGDGGTGGAGGVGGAGGGGGGGVSYAVYRAGTSTVVYDPDTTTFIPGTGGAGGAAATDGNAGTDGASGERNW